MTPAGVVAAVVAAAVASVVAAVVAAVVASVVAAVVAAVVASVVAAVVAAVVADAGGAEVAAGVQAASTKPPTITRLAMRNIRERIFFMWFFLLDKCKSNTVQVALRTTAFSTCFHLLKVLPGGLRLLRTTGAQ